MAKDSEVLLQPGHKWNNIVFHNHTGLKQYPNYMMGGGYLVSGDVAQTLMNVNRKMRLKFTPIEDATMGFWLAAMVRLSFAVDAITCQAAPSHDPLLSNANMHALTQGLSALLLITLSAVCLIWKSHTRDRVCNAALKFWAQH